MLRDLRPSRLGRAPRWFASARQNRRVRPSPPRPEAAPPVASEPRTLSRVLGCLGIWIALCGAAVGARAFALGSQRFALHELRTTPLAHVDLQRLADKHGLRRGVSLFALDLGKLERRLGAEPWVAAVRLRRELPHTVVVELNERRAPLAVALGATYLVDADGMPFKRARPEELVGVPTVTGLDRDRYLADPTRTRDVLRRAIELDRVWRASGARGAPGELHHDGGYDVGATFTVYFTHGGRTVAARLGPIDDGTPARLVRLDAVLAALDREGARPALIHLDQRIQLDRVAVRLADATVDRTSAL
jgi:cell division protein FtsQ